MPKVSEMNPSKYLKAEADCVDPDGDPADLHLTITEVRQETVGMGAQADKKWVLYFKEVDKGLVLNKTNTKAIAKLHGDDTDDWEGKRITLYQTEVEYQGETMLGIRVRLTAPKAKGKPGKNAPAPAPLAVTDENGVPIGDDGEPIF